MDQNPHDSAISVGLHNPMDNAFKAPSTAMQPLEVTTPPPLTKEQQIAQDQEIYESFAQASTAITVDSPRGDDDFSGDDGYETDSLGSATTSLSSSVRDYQFENGRRYHKFREGSYYFPNDASEQDREDLKHATMVRLLQRIYFAPIDENPQQILDLGTGTGIWAIEMGDQFPAATIRGVDLSPIQPEWVPPNVKFVVDDFESQWLYDDNFFDYIHTRHTVMAVRDWDRLYSQAFRHLKPGGWIESQEVVHLPHCSDGTMPMNWPIVEYWNLITSALSNSGVNFSSAPLLAQKMLDAGFTNVTEQILHLPLGPWARNKWLKMVGIYWRTVLYDGASAIALRPLTKEHGWSMQEVEAWLVEVRKAYLDDKVHAWMPLYLVQGQKPLDGMPTGSWDIHDKHSASQSSTNYTSQQSEKQQQLETHPHQPNQPIFQEPSNPPTESKLGNTFNPAIQQQPRIQERKLSPTLNLTPSPSLQNTQMHTQTHNQDQPQIYPQPHQQIESHHSQQTFSSPIPHIQHSKPQSYHTDPSSDVAQTEMPQRAPLSTTDLDSNMETNTSMYIDADTTTNPRKHQRQNSEDDGGFWGN